MAMLVGVAEVATRVSCRIEVATVDHGVRAESAADTQFVIDVAKGKGLAAHLATLELNLGIGFEARAREARYAALLRLRRERGLDWLLTAHTASDQAETVLMRLTRGSALAGSASIHAHRADCVGRPMLFAARDQVEAYLLARGQGWRDDVMNADPQFLRVKVRQSVVPLLETVAPGSTRALARFAALAAEDDAHLNGEASSALARLRSPDGALDRVGLCALLRPIARRVMARFLSEYRVEIDADLIDDALAAAAASHDATLPNDLVLACAHGTVRVAAAPPRHIHGTSSSVHGRGENS